LWLAKQVQEANGLTSSKRRGEYVNRPEYWIAQICQTGHVVSPAIDDYPGMSEKFCSICGEKTLMNCPNCQASLRGRSRYAGAPAWSRPVFCAECGKRFPWTDSAIEAALDFAREIQLQSDRNELADVIENLVRDTPKSVVMASRMKTLIGWGGPLAAEGFRKILIDVITESAKKMIWPTT
jgi:hypothetical protein